MKLIYSMEPLPERLSRSVFLAGPTPRTTAAASWRPAMLDALERAGFDGVVFIPEYRDGPQKDLAREEQIAWEHMCIHACDALVFWVARQMRPDFEMLALTTNVEYGLFLGTGKVFAGAPADAPHVDYHRIVGEQAGLTWRTDMDTLAADVVEYIGHGAARVGVEVQVPLGLWRAPQFQRWYEAQLMAGNYLEGLRELWRFTAPKSRQLFLTVFKPDVYVGAEDRVKENEFVVARTDISHVLAYTPGHDLASTRVVLVREFRCPAATADGFVHELPGGSSPREGVDPLTTAADELAEEVGLRLDPARFRSVGSGQCMATLAAHRAELFAVELTTGEMDGLAADRTVHGLAAETELIHLEVRTVGEVLAEGLLDWTNRGMLLNGLLRVLT